MKAVLAGWAILIAGLSLGAGCRRDAPVTPGVSAQAKGTGAPAEAPVVLVARVAAQKLAKTIHLTGELSAYRNVALYPKVQGFVEQITVDRGSEVAQGQLLVKLTAPEIEAQCREQQAKLAADDATYQRVREAAHTPGVVAGNDLQIAQRTVDADRARLAACAQNEAYLRIEAPFAGVITERTAHEGSMVGPNPVNAPPMLRIQEIARLRLVVYVPEGAVGTIPVGNKVKFTVAAYPGEIFGGVVAREAFSLDPKTRTMPVELDVENADRRLTPGMFAEVRWEISRREPSLFVPSSAVVTTTERKFVIRVRDGTAEWIDVEVGQQMAGVVEVFGELAAGDLVAIRGTDEIRSGLTVLPKEAS
jgi:membrane fusion protein, multidrug efflux system